MFQCQHDGAKIRNGPGVERMRQDLRYAMRQLRLAKGFATVVIFTLALGFGANTAMFSLVNAWLLRPLPLKDPQSLVAVWRSKLRSPKDPAYFPFYRDYLAWAQGRTFESLAGTFEQSYVLTGAGDPRRVQGAVATWNLFSTVGATAQIGRLFQPGDEKGEPECVISHVLWAGQFHSSPDVLMQTLTLNDKPYRVIGVLPPTFSLRVLDRSFETDVWTLISTGDPNYSSESTAAVAVIGRLNPGVTLAQAQTDLLGIQRLLNAQFSDEPPESGVLVVKLQEDNTRTIRSSLMLLFGAVAVLLLIACVNAGSLILGRHAQRTREFAVRAAMGCSSTRLLQQLTIEMLVLFGAGGIAGLLIASILLRAFGAWSPLGVLPAGGVSLDPLVLAATAGVVGSAALLFGSLPALRSLRSLDGDALRSGLKTTSAPAQVRARVMFVAAEISLSVILLVTAGLLISTFIRIGSEPLGFETQQVFVTDIALPYSRYHDVDAQSRIGEELSRRLQQLPTVRAAGVALSWPFNVDGLSAVEIQGQAEAKIEMLPEAAAFQIGQGYLEALGVVLLHGRSFSDQDLGHSLPVAVINDEMARRYFAGQDPIGQHIRLRFHEEKPGDEPWLTIVGVAGSTRSVRYNQIQWDRYPAVYTSLFQRRDRPGSVHNSNALTLYIYLEAPYPVEASTIAAAVHGLDPNLSISPLRRTGEIISSLRSQPRVRAILLGSFALLTLALAAVGVYGVMTQLAEQRRRDFGIRIALGASASNIRALVVRRALGLTGLGLGLGLFGAAIATRLLSEFLYGISALNPSIFAVVIVVLGAVAIIASYLPARRAAKVDPLETLRSE
ncbi:MAG TPA: ABC transporter permease [Terriglobales bacterium]